MVKLLYCVKNGEIKHGVSVQKMRWRPGEVNMGKGGTLWAQEEGVKKDAENKEGRGKRGMKVRIRDGGEGIDIGKMNVSAFMGAEMPTCPPPPTGDDVSR